MGIDETLTAPCSPWKSPYVERVIGLIRRECLEQFPTRLDHADGAFFGRTLGARTMDMLVHIRGRATRRPAKNARPARVALGWPSASLRTSPDAPASHFGPRLAARPSPEATALVQFGRKLL